MTESQDEQQIPPSPGGQGCAGESGVQPVAKPPIGLRPRWVVTENRLKEITAAMRRYREANKEIPLAWFEEMADIIMWLEVPVGRKTD